MVKKWAFALLFVVNLILANAQSFDFNDSCKQAYYAIVALRLDEGAATLAAEQKRHPDNLIPIYLENYIDFLRIYTSDSRTLYNRLNGNKDLRLEMIKAGDRNSPYYLFCPAEINIQWATMSIRFGDYLNAIMEIRKAYKFLEENMQRFPDFKANKKSLGVLYALLGSVPDKYKWGLNLLGMQGDIVKGLADLKGLVEYGKTNDYLYMGETVTMYSFLVFHLQNNPNKAWEILKENGFPQKDNLMSVFTCAHIGIYGQHTDDALQILQNKPAGKQYAAFPMLTYLTGLGKLHKLEADADTWFKKYIAEYKGDNHLKSSYQKIAWGYLLKGDSINYRHFMNKVLKAGTDLVEADKQAQKEAVSRQMPNVLLLRARLLFDGGYYEKAAAEMNKLSEARFSTPDDATEYLYRTGRIYHQWGKTDLAIPYYEKAIEKGKSLPRYFAANAALELAGIYELQGNNDKAKQFYNLCLGFENHEYKNGIDQKAKAGLSRLN